MSINPTEDKENVSRCIDTARKQGEAMAKRLGMTYDEMIREMDRDCRQMVVNSLSFVTGKLKKREG